MSTTRKSLLAIAAIAAVVSLAGPASAEAQTRRRTASDPWSMGVLGGVTWSGVSTKDDVNLSKVWGAEAGVFADHRLTPDLGGRVEVLISQRGAKNSLTGNTMRLAYLDVPLLVRFGNMTTNNVHVHAFTGLTPGFLLKTDTTTGGGLSSDISTDVKTFDLGWVIGAGVEQHAWSFDARYTFGLLNANNVPTGATFKNRSLGLNVGYRFR